MSHKRVVYGFLRCSTTTLLSITKLVAKMQIEWGDKDGKHIYYRLLLLLNVDIGQIHSIRIVCRLGFNKWFCFLSFSPFSPWALCCMF